MVDRTKGTKRVEHKTHRRIVVGQVEDPRVAGHERLERQRPGRNFLELGANKFVRVGHRPVTPMPSAPCRGQGGSYSLEAGQRQAGAAPESSGSDIKPPWVAA
jgi:hypothetical protein